jgi:hypothetical protein
LDRRTAAEYPDAAIYDTNEGLAIDEKLEPSIAAADEYKEKEKRASAHAATSL